MGICTAVSAGFFYLPLPQVDKVMFLPVFVCQQSNSKRYGLIFTKFAEQLDYVPATVN